MSMPISHNALPCMLSKHIFNHSQSLHEILSQSQCALATETFINNVPVYLLSNAVHDNVILLSHRSCLAFEDNNDIYGQMRMKTHNYTNKHVGNSL